MLPMEVLADAVTAPIVSVALLAAPSMEKEVEALRAPTVSVILLAMSSMEVVADAVAAPMVSVVRLATLSMEEQVEALTAPIVSVSLAGHVVDGGGGRDRHRADRALGIAGMGLHYLVEVLDP